jgi:hypothetical protein
MFCGAGVPPAVLIFVFTQRKPAGETLAPQKSPPIF